VEPKVAKAAPKITLALKLSRNAGFILRILITHTPPQSSQGNISCIGIGIGDEAEYQGVCNIHSNRMVDPMSLGVLETFLLAGSFM
jgi:hypothetical protein